MGRFDIPRIAVALAGRGGWLAEQLKVLEYLAFIHLGRQWPFREEASLNCASWVRGFLSSLLDM